MYENCPDLVVAAANVMRSVGVVNPLLSSLCTFTVTVPGQVVIELGGSEKKVATLTLR